jgi:hypothetical protein
MTAQFPDDIYPPEPAELIPDDTNDVEADDGEDSVDLTPDDGSNRPDFPDSDDDDGEG